MPLSKKRQAEYRKECRDRIVIPEPPREFEAWEITNWASYKDGFAPIPNCKDGRYRATN